MLKGFSFSHKAFDLGLVIDLRKGILLYSPPHNNDNNKNAVEEAGPLASCLLLTQSGKKTYISLDC